MIVHNRPDMKIIRQVMGSLSFRSKKEMLAFSWSNDPLERYGPFANYEHLRWVYFDAGPVFIIACNQSHPGVWNVASVGTKEFPNAAKFVTKHIRRVIIPALRAKGAHRAQTFSLAGDERVDRWFESLGAQKEGVARGLGRDGEDFNFFAWDWRE